MLAHRAIDKRNHAYRGSDGKMGWRDGESASGML